MNKLEYNSRKFSYILLITLLFLLSNRAAVAVEVIINKSVSANDYSFADIRAIFTMKKREWSNGHTIQVYTLPDSHPTHKKFVKNVLQLFPHQLRRIWERITFSGIGVAPTELSSEQEMRNKIMMTPDAIGYLDTLPHDDNIHVLSHQ